ncbi:chromosome segregation protein SMC [Spirochaetota bacterium]|nr:chromosome segregation protein SMC [Spirochaetota bacterium]
MKIEYIRLKNFKAFKDVEMEDIPDFCVLVGANGTGKTTLFQVFNFLKDALESSVDTALRKLGGSRKFKEVRSRNTKGAIEIELRYKTKPGSTNSKNPLIHYFLKINEENDSAYVEKEYLSYPHPSRKGKSGRYWRYIDFSKGKGRIVVSQKTKTRQKRTFNKDYLALNGLAIDGRYKKVQPLVKFIKNFHVSDIRIDKARSDSYDNEEELSPTGDNLAGVIGFLHDKHKDVLKKIISILEECISHLDKVNVKENKIDGSIALEFKEKRFQKPFLAKFVSEGTIKLLAYLVLLYTPHRYPLICVEEPENQIYPKFVQDLAEEFRFYTESESGGQVFVTTHSPEFLNAVEIEEAFYLEKKWGYTTVQNLSKNKQVKEQGDNDAKLGELWNEGFFGQL